MKNADEFAIKIFKAFQDIEFGNVSCKILVIISSDPINSLGLTLIQAWVSNRMPIKLWDEIADDPFTDFKRND